MSTTAILVEILIIGMQAMVWLVLLVLSVFGYKWLPDTAAAVKGWEPAVSVLALGLCYTLGILVDRVADCLTALHHPGDTLLKISWIKRQADAAHSDTRMRILCSTNKAGEFLAHVRSRTRIARATVVNVLLGTGTAVLFLATRTSYDSLWTLAGVVIVGLLVAFVFALALGVLEVTYYTRLNQAKLYLEGQEEEIADGEK